MIRETEFIVQQHYKVTVDASSIDKHYNKHHKDLEIVNWEKEQNARFHRMFQAIIANKEVLDAVLEYEALAEYTSDTGTDFEIREDHYGDEDYDFGNILTKFQHIFSQEDQDWWASLVEDKEDKNFDLLLQVEPLEECFKAKPSGWNIQEHLCARKVED